MFSICVILTMMATLRAVNKDNLYWRWYAEPAPAAMQTLLDGVRARLPLAGCRNYYGSEPSTVEADRFVDYQRAGVNRIPIGVQKF